MTISSGRRVAESNAWSYPKDIVVTAVPFLAADDSDYMTGPDDHIDGAGVSS